MFVIIGQISLCLRGVSEIKLIFSMIEE